MRERVELLKNDELQKSIIKKIPLEFIEDKIFSHDCLGSPDFEFENQIIKTSSFQIAGIDWWKPVFNLNLKYRTYETWDYQEINEELNFLDQIPDPLKDQDGKPKMRKMKFDYMKLYLFSSRGERFEVIVH